MKKYRFVGSDPKLPWYRRTAPVLYLFLGWNALGIALYQVWKTRVAGDEFQKKTSTQKYLGMVFGEECPDKFKHVKIQGLTVQTEHKTVADYWNEKIDQGKKQKQTNTEEIEEESKFS